MLDASGSLKEDGKIANQILNALDELLNYDEVSFNNLGQVADGSDVTSEKRWTDNESSSCCCGWQLTIDLIPLDKLWPPEVEINVYRIVQESLNNIVKHAQADEARISIEHQSESVVITIRDNGRGFAPKAGEAKKNSFGLTGMAERVRILGGELAIHSAPGQGTTVTVRLKLTGSSNGGRHDG